MHSAENKGEGNGMQALSDAYVWAKDMAFATPVVWRWAMLAFVSIGIGWLATHTHHSRHR